GDLAVPPAGRRGRVLEEVLGRHADRLEHLDDDFHAQLLVTAQRVGNVAAPAAELLLDGGDRAALRIQHVAQPLDEAIAVAPRMLHAKRIVASDLGHPARSRNGPRWAPIVAASSRHLLRRGAFLLRAERASAPLAGPPPEGHAVRKRRERSRRWGPLAGAATAARAAVRERSGTRLGPRSLCSRRPALGVGRWRDYRSWHSAVIRKGP